jgi:toxin-antitoxin system PIN domain toxin
VNVLVALAWPNHIHHRRAVAWFVETRLEGWATCPTTESGFVRVSSNARAIQDARTPAESIHLLQRLQTTGRHVFWKDGVSISRDPFGLFARVVGHRQMTDAHLLSVALSHGGCLATFDRGLLALADAHRHAVLLIDGG